MIFRGCRIAAALGLMRRLGRGGRPGPPLSGDPDLAEIIVTDDDSSDRTASVGEQHCAAGLAGRALPPGSAGKGWALDHGLRAARGDLVLLLDAKYLPRSGSHAARPVDRTCRHGENP